MKRIVQLLAMMLCLSLLFTGTVSADVQEEPLIASEYVSEDMFKDFEEQAVSTNTVPETGEALSLTAQSALLMEVSTGQVLFEKNADEQRHPASITKVMTLLLVMEAIEAGKIFLDSEVTCSEHAASMGGSQIWLEPGETMTVDELLKATCVASANDAATALSEFVAGSEEAFVSMMNDRAKELGMTNTNFVNCCGLDAEGHMTTARDIAIMSCALVKHELIKEYSQIWIDYLRGGSTQLVNTNKLVRFYPGTTGLKTGTTDDAGYCVSASAKRDEMELVAVVLAGDTSDHRFQDAKKMLDYGFANWGIVQINMDEIALNDVQVIHGVNKKVGVRYEPVETILVPKGKRDALEPVVTLPPDVLAPVAEGQVLGKVTFTLDGTVVAESRLFAQSSVEKMGVWDAFASLLRSLASL